MKRNHELFGLILVFLVSGAIYLKTVCPSLYLEDSGEFISSAYTLGINHPPGYPLLTLANKIITFLPIGAIPFRVNLFGTLLGGIGAVLFLLLLLRFEITYPISLISALLLAASRLWWSQALQPEVYLLNGVIGLLILLFFLRSSGQSMLLPLLWGIGFTNHYLILGFVPLVFWGSWKDQKPLFSRMIGGLILLLLGMAIYLYLPIRGKANTEVGWRHSPATLSGVTTMLSRKQFKRIEFSHSVTLKEKWLFLVDFAKKMMEQGTFILLILAGLGAFLLFHQAKSLFFWLCYLFLVNS